MPKLGLNQILLTKDGRKIGNAIVIKESPLVIKTDYGTTLNSLSEKEISELFYLADMTEHWDVSNHKNFVNGESEDKRV